MLLIKICQQFLLPSVFIPVFILIGFIFLLTPLNPALPRHRRDRQEFRQKRNYLTGQAKKKGGAFLVILGLVLYYLFSISPVSDLIIAPLENKYPKLEQNELQQADKAVLLLGGQESDVLRASEALRIYNRPKVVLKPEGLKDLEKPVIYIAGRDFLSKQNQALKLRNYLIERGIDEENVLLEDESKTTFESSQNIGKILGQEPFFLITSAYHLPRSVWIFKKNNTNPIPAPADFKIQNEYDLFDFFPAANNLKNVDTAFHEYFGILYYMIKY